MSHHGRHATNNVTLFASATRAATTNGTAQPTSVKTKEISRGTTGFNRHLMVFLDITTVTGTSPTMTVKVQGRIDTAGAWTDLPSGAFSAQTAAGQTALRIDGPLPAEIRGVATIGGSGSLGFTFSCTAVLGG